jgi:predicted Mrr-cat superfamily restriction endonuclease
MAVWVVRQDSPQWQGWDQIALEKGVAIIDFGLRDGVFDFRDRRELANYLREHAHPLYGYKSGRPRMLSRQAGQVWRFYKCIAPGDIAVYHVWEDERRVRVGEFLDGGAYQKEFPDYCEGWRSVQPDPIVFQVRSVNWLANDIPMSAFVPDLKLDAPGTVYKPSYVDADAHVREVLQKHRNAGLP